MRTSFEVAVLASGSKGNATLIKVGKTAFLVDAGISCKRITERLKFCGVEPQDLAGILITHEHIDHVSGLPVLSRKYKLPIYANEKTWQAMPKRNDIERICCRLLPQKMVVGGVSINSFAISHDAASPVGFVFQYNEEKCTYLTDSGFVNDTIKQAAADADVMILEANHDETMLLEGSYPRDLKARILGSRGHLSNTTAGMLLAQMAKKPQEVFLAHLSQENNKPELALATVQNILQQAKGSEQTEIYVAAQDAVVQNIFEE